MNIEGISEDIFKCDDYFVAYFDVLGTKASLKSNEKETLQKLWLVNNLINTLRYENKDITIRAFSDNYLFAIKVDDKNPDKSLNTLFNAAASFAIQCLSIYELLIRGAIVRGPLHIDANTIIGESLIKAYELENRVAVYPRVIIADGVINNMNVAELPIRNLKSPYFKDYDSCLCVNPLFFFNEKIRHAMKGRLANNIINSAMSAYKINDAHSIMKVEWTINYVNDFYLQHYGTRFIAISKDAFKKAD